MTRDNPKRGRMYLSPPHMAGIERELLLDAYDSNWIAPLGPHVDGFEADMCSHLGQGHAAALSSGTAALHLALILLAVPRDAEVWCSTLTFAASANPIAYVGAVPVFIDSTRATWNLDPAIVQEEIPRAARSNRLPKALIAVDLYGQCADYESIVGVCSEYGVPVIADAAESLGSTYRGACAGAQGSFGILSFNGNKIITTSGGGMLWSSDRTAIERARFLATQARDPAPHYEHSAVGYNYRMSNLLAAVGRGQLRHLGERVARRRAINQRYRAALASTPGVELMPEAEYGSSNCWLTCITIDSEAYGATPDELRLLLESHDIEARPVWKPMHQQPVYSGCRCFGGEVADSLFAHGLCLPSGSIMSDGDVDEVAGLVVGLAR